MKEIVMDRTLMPYVKRLGFAGAVCDLYTDSSVLAYELERFSTGEQGAGLSSFAMHVTVDEESQEAGGAAHFRGLHHVVTASFGSANLFVFDVLRRRLSARVSGAVARDAAFWKEKLIPIALGVLGAAMGLLPVHCACLELDGDGLLVAGQSGAGKSTLSVALSQGGFNYVSDDWTYVSERKEGLVAHGTSAPVKLLPDAVRHFRALEEHSTHISMNGEEAYEVDIAQTFKATVERWCEPRWLVFLERREEPGAEFVPVDASETMGYLARSVEQLPVQLTEAARTRERVMRRIAQLPCWRLRYGGTPQFAAGELLEFVARRQQEVYA